jgi:hypothetical protein
MLLSRGETIHGLPRFPTELGIMARRVRGRRAFVRPAVAQWHLHRGEQLSDSTKRVARVRPGPSEAVCNRPAALCLPHGD